MPLPHSACAKGFDFCDTFLDPNHVVESFPSYKVEFVSGEGTPLKMEEATPPFRIKFPKSDYKSSTEAIPESRKRPIENGKYA